MGRVFHLLQNLKVHKACGPDGISICLLKETAEVASILLLIFRASLKQGKIPKEWKHAHVTPVFKNGN